MQVLWRDLAGFVRSPIAYSVGALFLAVQGTLFWTLVELLSDPSEPAPMGAVLASFFGGQVLYWLITFVVVATATMRLFAEERRSGTWESLMTAPVSDASVVIQKWAAAFAFAAALWLPTLVYPLVIGWFSPPEVTLDAGVLLSSYTGVLAQLGAFVALGVAASAATRSQVVAAASVVLILVALLLIGQIPDLIQLERSWLRASIEAVDLRRQLQAAARGELRLDNLAVYASVIMVALHAAHAWSGRGRLRRDGQSERWLATVMVAVVAASGCILLVRHPQVWDLSASRVNRLSPHTERALARVGEPVDIVVLEPSFDRFAPIYDEVERVIERMARAQPLLRHRVVPASGSPELALDSARLFGLPPEQLAEGGMIAVVRGDRRVVIELLDFAEFDSDSLGVGTVSRLLVEDVLRAAIEDVAALDTPLVCFTDVSGELPAADPARFAELERRLALDGLRALRVGRLGAEVPAECRVVAVIAPTSSVGDDAVLALGRWLKEGGALLVVANSSGSIGGLELAVAEGGISVGAGRIEDPDNEPGRSGMWLTSRGHSAEHPISRPFFDRRTTAWSRPRPLVVRDGAEVLVSSSDHSWIDRSAGPARRDPDDPRGPHPVAAASTTAGGPIVVLSGGAGPELDAPVANLELLASALAWLAGRKDIELEAAERRTTIRLLMTDGQRTLVFLLCVVLLPLVYLAIGGLLWWRRRRG